MYKPIVLIILDGWGISESTKGNPIKKATLPTIDKLNSFYPHIKLEASGIAVGLPWSEPGNSEVGHITLGTGRIIYQNMPKITLSIQDGSFFKNQSLLEAAGNAKQNDRPLHIMGLLGNGIVHSSKEHLFSLLELAKNQGVKEVYLHLFTDGRDSKIDAGKECLRELEEKIKNLGIGKIATLCGRAFAMDRNNKWDRIEKAYRVMTEGQGIEITDPKKYLEESYAKEVYDEYIEPAFVKEGNEFPGRIEDGDSLIFFNFREDRAREITKAFVLPGFTKFERSRLKNLFFVGMTHYEDGLPISVAFPPDKVKESLGSLISKKNFSQLRIAETEKFAHVTYFFNGGKEDAFSKEDRIIVPSPSHIEKYDEAPEMSADKVTEKLLAAIDKEKYNFILVNYANADMVAHTGNEAATVKAVEKVDQCLSQVIPEVIKKNGCILITADHGNAEEVFNSKTGVIDTEHSINPVPLWFITSENHADKPRKDSSNEVQGMLNDIAPTILDLMNIEKPEEMTGESLLPLLQ